MRCRCRVSGSISFDTNTGDTALGATAGITGFGAAIIAFDVSFWVNVGKTRRLCWKRVVRWSRDTPMKRAGALRRIETWPIVRTEFKARDMMFLSSGIR